MSVARDLQLLSREIPWIGPGIDNDEPSLAQTPHDLRICNAGVAGVGLVRVIRLLKYAFETFIWL